jgi:hypothetical protein
MELESKQLVLDIQAVIKNSRAHPTIYIDALTHVLSIHLVIYCRLTESLEPIEQVLGQIEELVASCNGYIDAIGRKI